MPSRRYVPLIFVSLVRNTKNCCPAGAGSGEAWQPCGSPTADYQIEALRRRVIELGGQLTVLLQPGSLPAWLDAPSRPLIEAVKRQFDPKQQLSRGRLPGVAAPYN